jgi:hypothetical protein
MVRVIDKHDRIMAKKKDFANWSQGELARYVAIVEDWAKIGIAKAEDFENLAAAYKVQKDRENRRPIRIVETENFEA